MRGGAAARGRTGFANKLMGHLRSSQSPHTSNSVSVAANIRRSVESVTSLSGLSGTGGSASNT